MVIEKKPLVSAIVSTFNSEKFIRGKINDLFEQTIVDQLEIIIVNSGSKQNEDSIIKEYISHPNITYIHTEERESIYKAWNRGIKSSHGIFITNSNTDDRLKNNALEVLSLTLIQNPDVALVYADQFISNVPNEDFSETIKKKSSKRYSLPDYNYFYQLDRCLMSSQPMWRSSLHFEENIWFDEKYEILGDYEFELKISQKHKLLHIKEELGIFYLSPTKENKSHNDLSQVNKEREEISEPYIVRYLNDKTNDGETDIIAMLKRDIKIPLPIYYFWKRVCLLINPKLITDRFFFSIEFMYYFIIVKLENEKRIVDAVKLGRRFLRYGKSRRIENRIKKLSN